MSNIECFSKAIKEIYETRGNEAFLNVRLFHALIDDLVPVLTNERKIFHTALDDSILKDFLLFFENKESDQQYEAVRIKNKIENVCGISNKWSSFIVECFIVAAGCKIDFSFLKEEIEEENNLTFDTTKKETINNLIVTEDDYKNYISNLIVSNPWHIFGITSENEVCACGSGDGDYDSAIVNSTKKWKNVVSLHESPSVCEYGLMVFGLTSRGTVYVSQEKYKGDPRSAASKWSNIKAISAGFSHVVGVKNDGTVVACGKNQFNSCNVSTWKNVDSVQAYSASTVGVLKNGDVVYTGDKHGLKTFHNIAYMDNHYVIGLRKDGMLAVADSFWDWKENDPTEWLLSLKNVKRIKTSLDAIAVLFNDGSVQCMHRKHGLYKKAEKWKNIIDVVTETRYLIGIDEDGNVLIVDENDEITITENINNAFFATFRMNNELIILQNNGRIKNISLPNYEADSWTYTTRSWILFSPEFNSTTDFKKFRYNEGSCYIGDWYNSKRHGNGTYINPSGEKLVGEFKNDRIFNGNGVVIYNDGKFIGSYVNAVKEGKGKRIWNSGNKYEGEFADNKANGIGTFTWADGSVWEGEFKDDQPWTGEGTWKYADGKIKTGKWKNGKKKLF